MRDLKAVGTKFKHVIRPSDKKCILKDCMYFLNYIYVFYFNHKPCYKILVLLANFNFITLQNYDSNRTLFL